MMVPKLRVPSVRSSLDILSSIAVIVASVSAVYHFIGQRTSGVPELQVPSEAVRITDAPLRGDRAAKTVLVVYSDFQCPFCGRFAREVLPEIQRQYVDTGRAAIAFKHLPLGNHAQAVPAAISAECAGRQNRFWEAHDKLFEGTELNETIIQTVPEELGLDMQQFKICLADPTLLARVKASATEATTFGISSTPTFFLGVREGDGGLRVLRTISGAQSLGVFVDNLEAVLSGDQAGWRSWVPWM